MSIGHDVEVGDKLYYCKFGSTFPLTRAECKEVIVTRSLATFVEVDGKSHTRYRVPGGGAIGNGWGEFLSHRPWSLEELHDPTEEDGEFVEKYKEEINAAIASNPNLEPKKPTVFG